jgi:hypothetical protein
MKKYLFIVAISFLLCLSILAQTEKAHPGQVASSEALQPGQIVFKGERNQNRYFASLKFKLAEHRTYSVRGLKVTSEPSGTTLFALYDSNCTEEMKQVFMRGKTPLSTIESQTISETMAPAMSIDYPVSISSDNQIVVEYLIENNGMLSTMLGAAITVRSVDSVVFAVIPFPNNSRTEEPCLHRIICCDPPVSRCCPTPVGTCCCQCDVNQANCGAFNCPPPPC